MGARGFAWFCLFVAFSKFVISFTIMFTLFACLNLVCLINLGALTIRRMLFQLVMVGRLLWCFALVCWLLWVWVCFAVWVFGLLILISDWLRVDGGLCLLTFELLCSFNALLDLVLFGGLVELCG